MPAVLAIQGVSECTCPFAGCIWKWKVGITYSEHLVQTAFLCLLQISLMSEVGLAPAEIIRLSKPDVI